MKRNERLVGVLALALGLAACSSQEGGEVRAEQVDAVIDTTGARIINVEATPIALQSFVDYIRITGEVEAMYDITVSAEESGVIERFLVEKGRRVRRGQTIAKIDDAVLSGQVQEARSVADVAEEQYQRQRRLWEEEEIGSEIAYLQLKSASEAAKARLQVLEERLSRTEIKAPVSGIYDEKFVEAGEMVATGTPVVRVIAMSQVKVVGGVPERFALSVHRGDSARITLDPLGGREFLGVIEFVGTTVDAGNRTFPIEVVLDNPENVIKSQRAGGAGTAAGSDRGPTAGRAAHRGRLSGLRGRGPRRVPDCLGTGGGARAVVRQSHRDRGRPGDRRPSDHGGAATGR